MNEWAGRFAEHREATSASSGRCSSKLLRGDLETDPPTKTTCWLLHTSPATYGFIDETIPELSIAVRADLRGRGIATDLLRALVRAAREQGVRALSLSVEEGNPALRLYERIGFRPVEKASNASTMRLDLEPGTSGH